MTLVKPRTKADIRAASILYATSAPHGPWRAPLALLHSTTSSLTPLTAAMYDTTLQGGMGGMGGMGMMNPMMMVSIAPSTLGSTMACWLHLRSD